MSRRLAIRWSVVVVFGAFVLRPMTAAATNPPAAKPTKPQADIGALWSDFQRSAPGRYCFHHREKYVSDSHNSAVFVSIEADGLVLTLQGVLRPANNEYVYSEELRGSRRGTKIVATFKGGQNSVEFAIGDRTLTTNHYLTKKRLTYTLERCRRK